MKYFIGYLGEGDVARYRKEIARDLAGRFGVENLADTRPAHLTLKYPFDSDDTSNVEKAVEIFLKDRVQIPFTISGFDRFDGDASTVFLNVEYTEELYSLVRDFVTCTKDIDEEQKFEPDAFRLHMSVARHLGPAASDSILKYLATLARPHFKLSFDNITLFEKEADVWKVRRIFRMV